MAAEKLTLGELIQTLAKKAGIKTDQFGLQELIDNAEISGYEIQKELADGFNGSLISLQAAKDNHPEISRVYRAQALDGIDAVLKGVIDEMEIDDTVKTALTSEGSTYKRTENVIKTLKELKKQSSDKGDKGEYQRQIDELQKIVKEQKESFQKEKGEIINARKKDLVNFALINKLSSFKTILDKSDSKYRNRALVEAINEELNAKGANFEVDETGNFQLVGKEGSKVYGDDNTEVNPDDLIKNALIRNNLLVASEPTPGPTPPAGAGPNPPAKPGETQKHKYANQFNSEMLKHFEK